MVMPRNQEISANGAVASFIIVLSAIAMERGFVANRQWYWVLLITLPLLISLLFDQRKQKPS